VIVSLRTPRHCKSLLVALVGAAGIAVGGLPALATAASAAAVSGSSAPTPVTTSVPFAHRTVAPTADAGGPAAAPVVAPDTIEQVQLAVTPRDRAGLRRLAATASTLSEAARAARLNQVMPGTARVDEVADRAEALGLQVVSTTPTVVTASGPAELVRSLFGSARAKNPKSPTAQSLPDLPPSLLGLVTVAAGGDETRPARYPLNSANGSLSQSDLRSVYHLDSTGTAVPSASSPTIATIQFSNWHPSDLTGYVSRANVYGGTAYDPVASGGYSSIKVGTGPVTSSGAADYSGQLEVALDQEALATVAPDLRQAAYFAPNTALGQAQALSKITADAASRHTLVVSTSWGNCEQASYPDFFAGRTDPTLAADEDAMSYALASGLTIFASSGDHGSFDCVDANGNTIAANAVDAPASLPYVIGVGGTTTHVSGSSVSLSGWDGSGGGYSAIYCATAEQAPALPSAASAPDCSSTTSKARGVPDIAANGDPDTGLPVYSPGGCSGTCIAGGTSLAAPLAAGGFAATLAAREYTVAGVGYIAGWLYGSGASGLLDVTSGSNGGYVAQSGWDAVTGLGSPRWAELGAIGLMKVGTGPVSPPSSTIPMSVTVPTGNALSKWKAAGHALSTADCASASGGAPPSSVALDAGSSVVGVVAVDAEGNCHIVNHRALFTDVPVSSTFATQIYGLAQRGVIDGYSDGSFRPGIAVSRQAFAAFLARSLNLTATAGTCTSARPSRFTDVPNTNPFCVQINTLAGIGIIDGYADGGFHPAATITRQATAAFLDRTYAQAHGTSPTACTQPIPFHDVAASNPFCGDIEFLVAHDITTGYADGGFHPAATVTRQATAAFLYRYLAL
jgi:kumamolisin